MIREIVKVSANLPNFFSLLYYIDFNHLPHILKFLLSHILLGYCAITNIDCLPYRYWRGRSVGGKGG